nr:MAG TPA: hypothetical protein [Caudoviricetes sp.]
MLLILITKKIYKKRTLKCSFLINGYKTLSTIDITNLTIIGVFLLHIYNFI